MDQLTPSQQAAVLYDQNLILFAGPGSGKTKTAAAKGLRILQQPDAHLTMVTFTTAGASELKTRLLSAFSDAGKRAPTNRITTGTFHSLALKHYQRHARTRKKLISPAARSSLIAGMLAHLEFERRAEMALDLERYQGALYPENVDLDDEVREFIKAYLTRLNGINAIDLATMMRECVIAMSAGEIPLLPVTHLLGDEMQDADQVQLELMLLHAKNGVITTLVGDDDQTIYEWRSALGYEGLMRFAKESGAKTITLAENFRSRSEIVAHAQRLIAFNNPHRIDKNPHAVRGEGGLLGVVKSGSLENEGKHIARAIAAHRMPGESVAILARSNRDLDTMEQQLMRHVDEVGTPAPLSYIRDGQSIWQTTEVETLTCLLRAVLGGHTTDFVPVLSILPVAPLTRSSLEQALGPTCGAFLDGSLPDFRSNSTDDDEQIKRLMKVTAFLRRKVRAGELAFAIQEAAEEVRRLFLAQKPKGGTRIDALLGAAANVLMGLQGPLSQRLNVISRSIDRDPERQQLRLMTMHSSKGLEFDTVFVLNATDPDDGSTLIEDQAERRLFYVAMTRAKNRLVVSYSDKAIKFIEEAGLPHFLTLSELLAPVR